MRVLLATEIWGRTPHVDALAETLQDVAEAVTVVDPYDGEDPGFADEGAAYAAFLERCGHDAYAQRVCREMERAGTPLCLVGFSAGAGAVWAAAGRAERGSVRGAVCFYGSSIRTMLDRFPNVRTDLIFPDHEPHFDVDAVLRELRGRDRVRCHKTPYGHGFMNPLSANFDRRGYARWLDWTKRRIQALSLDEAS